MRYLKGTTALLIIIVALASCTSDQSLERRITALERRVAELENGPTAAAQKAAQADVKLASTPEIIPTNDGPKPAFNFGNIEHDFGTVNEGEIVNYTYSFTNNGETPLVIEKAVASCGCTVPEWPKEPIPAGGSGEIKVRFDTKNKPNQQIKTITITANTEPTLTRLRLKGFVTPKSQQPAGPVSN